MAVYLHRDETEYRWTKQLCVDRAEVGSTVHRLIDEGFQTIEVDRQGVVFGQGSVIGRIDIEPNYCVVWNAWQQDGAVITAKRL